MTKRQIGTAWLLMHDYVTGVFCLQGMWVNSSTLITMAIGSGSVWRSTTPGYLPILTGNPAGSCSVMKSLSLAKWALLMAIRSMIGSTCSCRDNGWFSESHRVARNFWILVVTSLGRPMSRPSSGIKSLKYSSGWMSVGFVKVPWLETSSCGIKYRRSEANTMVTASCKRPSQKSNTRWFSKTLRGTWLSCGSYRVYAAVTGSTWLLRGLYVHLFCAKMVLRGSYRTDLHEGVTTSTALPTREPPTENFIVGLKEITFTVTNPENHNLN